MLKRRGIAAFLWLVVACSGFPYQEISDARQAYQAAEQAVAERPHLRPLLEEAEHALRMARRSADKAHYKTAREYAMDAKTQAIRLREMAIGR